MQLCGMKPVKQNYITSARYSFIKPTDKKSVKAALAKGLDIENDCDNFELLHYACRYNWFSIAKYILKKNPDLITYLDYWHSTPLHTAASNSDNQCKCIKYLLKHEPSTVHWKNRLGNTPLHHACHQKNFKAIQLLIKYKADVTIQNLQGKTPLAVLYSHNKEKERELLRFFEKHKHIAQLFLHSVDDKKNTQLHLCTAIHPKYMRNLKHYIDFLISQGLNIHAKNNNDQNPLNIMLNRYNLHYGDYIKGKDQCSTKSILLYQDIKYYFLYLNLPHPPLATLLQDALAPLLLHNKDILTFIVRLYYLASTETILIKKYVHDEHYPNPFHLYHKKFFDTKYELLQQLRENPEPHLLWNR
jgi:ankyrin repeat protein